MSFEDGLISVVIPAYNSERTLGATLESVCRQVYQPIEIIVVDDGSTDNTAAVAQRVATQDSRIRILSVANGGVARARNAGFAASRGEFIAPIDADDLWHPEKLAKQIAVMRQDPTIGFVYTFYRRINTENRVLYDGGSAAIEGRVYLRLLFDNFVGNGSALLVRREAWEQVGGYAPELHDQQAQGCEDGLFQIMIAHSWKIGVARGYYTGYRCTPGAMSTDGDRMRRSHRAMVNHVMRRYPETPAAEIRIRLGIAYRDLRRIQLSDARSELQRVVRLLRNCDSHGLAFVALSLPELACRKLFLKAEIFARNAVNWLLRHCDLGKAELPYFQTCDPHESFGEQPAHRNFTGQHPAPTISRWIE